MSHQDDIKGLLDLLRQAKKGQEENPGTVISKGHQDGTEKNQNAQSYESVKGLVKPFLKIDHVETEAKIELLDHLAFWDAAEEIKSNRWERQSKLHRRRFCLAQKQYQQTKNTDNAILFATVILDMVNIKLKLFEMKGNNVDEKLVQKMTFYNTRGIEVLEQMSQPTNDLDKQIRATFLLAQLHTKFFSSNKDIQRKHTQEAIKAYEKVQSIGSTETINETSRALVLKSQDAKDLLERQMKVM